MASYRKKRVGELLLSFLAEELRQLNEPAYGFVTLTGVEVSGDLRVAKVFWSLMNAGAGSSKDEQPISREFPQEKQVAATEEALQELVPFLKRRIGEELQLRFVPQLVMKHDASLATGFRIDQLLDALPETSKKTVRNGDEDDEGYES